MWSKLGLAVGSLAKNASSFSQAYAGHQAQFFMLFDFEQFRTAQSLDFENNLPSAAQPSQSVMSSG
jgi:hypothetical protein